MNKEEWDLETKDLADKEILVREKCIKQLVPIAERNVKYLFSQPKASQFTAAIATKNIRSFERINDFN